MINEYWIWKGVKGIEEGYLSQDSRSDAWNLNQRGPEYEAGIPAIGQRLWVINVLE
jgi:hypothetical protein